MDGVLKSLLSALMGLTLFIGVLSVFGSAWPAWALALSGFVGGNVIVAACTMAFLKEWGLASR
jgi:hypothetical protein